MNGTPYENVNPYSNPDGPGRNDSRDMADGFGQGPTGRPNDLNQGEIQIQVKDQNLKPTTVSLVPTNQRSSKIEKKYFVVEGTSLKDAPQTDPTKRNKLIKTQHKILDIFTILAYILLFGFSIVDIVFSCTKKSEHPYYYYRLRISADTFNLAISLLAIFISLFEFVPSLGALDENKIGSIFLGSFISIMIFVIGFASLVLQVVSIILYYVNVKSRSKIVQAFFWVVFGIFIICICLSIYRFTLDKGEEDQFNEEQQLRELEENRQSNTNLDDKQKEEQDKRSDAGLKNQAN